jgi:IS5 family transposase
VDSLLDDPVFFAPFAPYFHPVLGRPSTPVECYLRLMFLKYRYRLGFESLCAEVSDPISWRRFCRIPLGGAVPHPTTLMKLTTRCGRAAVDGLNEALPANARRALRRAVGDLEQLLEATRQVAAQARRRLAGTMPDGATRRVSLHEPDALPIAKGRLGKPVEFGCKAEVTDNDDGVVLDYAVEQGNPADGPQLTPAIGRVINRTGKKPRTVTANRGYGEKAIEDDLRALGVRHVAIPAQGQTRPGPPGGRTPARVPAGRQVANRLRRPDQHPQTPIRMGPHLPGRHRRSPDLDRIRDPGPQPIQDQHPGQLTPTRASAKPARPTCPKSARKLFQVEVASGVPGASRGVT